jgi:hypothetical protein
MFTYTLLFIYVWKNEEICTGEVQE